MPDAASRRSQRPPARSGIALITAAVLSAAVGTALAQWRDWDSDFDEGRRPWKEIEARIPSYPGSGDWVPFDAGGTSRHRYYVDARSLSVGEDGVVRYTLVVRTAGGATNVTFEGIRCELREQKYYAVGHPDGNWARARNPQWRRIEPQDINRHHYALYSEFLCAGGRPVASVREMLQRLRSGSPGAPAGG